MRRVVWILVCFLCVASYGASAQYLDSGKDNNKAAAADVNAAELVRAVRESENWIHQVDSFFLRIESKWTRTSKAIAIEAQGNKGRSSRMRSTNLKPVSMGTLEYAIDHQNKRVRFVRDTSGERQAIRIWDGEQLISYYRSFTHGQESYHLESTLEGRSFHELIACETSWPRAQPHSFWFDRKDTDEILKVYGYPEDFVLKDRSNYRGVDCYVLECDRTKVHGIVSGLVYRWYVGTDDKLLYGNIKLRYGKPDIEHWALDYKEVAPSCWFPMTQGYELYDNDSNGLPYLRSRRDLKVLKVRVNEKLPDELFKMELKEGVEVTDRRSGDSVTYLYKPELPSLVGKPLPELKDLKVELSTDPNDKMVLVCFWDMQQRPSRNCVRQLAKQAEEFKERGVTIVAVQASRVDENALNEWVKKYNIPFAVGMVEGDEEETRFAWSVKSLPWLILTDKEHIVRAEGFGIEQLDEKLTETGSKTQLSMSNQSLATEVDLNICREEGLKSFFHSSSIPEDLIKDPNKMDPDALITVRTIDHEGKSVPYSRIVFVNRDEKTTRSFHETATNKDGYAYCDLISDTFSINAHLYEYNPKTKDLCSQHKKIGELYNVQHNKLVTVKWDPFPTGSGKVEGHVLDQYGKPLTKFKIRLRYLQGVLTDWSESYSTYQSIEVDNPQGHFEVGELAPRTYSYMIRAEDYSAYAWDFDMGQFTIPEEPNSIVELNIEVEAKELLYGRAYYLDGSPVNRGVWTLWFEKYPPEQMSHERGRYFALGMDLNGFFRVTLSEKERGELLQCTEGWVDISDSSGLIGKVHIEKLSKESEQAPTFYFPRGEPRDSLVGLAVPEFEDIQTDYSPEQAKDKRVLVCFFDMDQRPSRNCIMRLAKQAEQLKQKGVAVVAVQASKVDEDTLNEWVKKYNIPFAVGMVQGDEEETRFAWGVRSLPWLILTDDKRVVRAEGFGLSELNEKINEATDVEP